MSIVRNFNGKRVIEPGVYAQTRSGIPAKANNFPFGDLMIIDTGSGAEWGGGSGINGELSSGLESVYSFEDPNDYRAFMSGGLLWDFSEFIFNPLVGAPAPERVYIVKAATTVGAKLKFNGLTNGSIEFICRNEGVVGNGVLNETKAKAVISFMDADLVSGNILTITVTNAGSNPVIVSALSVPVGATPSSFKRLVSQTINDGTSGYKAEVKGSDVIIYAPNSLGASANTHTLAATGTAGTTAVINDFYGGVDGTSLVKGYGAELLSGEDDNAKFMIKFWGGSFNGKSPNGYYYGGLKENEVKANLFATSPEFSNISELIEWAETDYLFNKTFKLSPNYSISGGGNVVVGDLTTYNDLQLAVDGSEVYGAADLDKVLEDIKELGNTFFLCDRFGDEAKSVQNGKILSHILNESEFDKFMIVGGGIDETRFEKNVSNSSLDIASFYDNERVIVVHGGNRRADFINGGEEVLPSIYHAANVAGRLGGLEPQVPLTFKALRIQNFVHTLGKRDREKALQGGVLHNRFVPGIGNVVNQGINSLQRNTQQINPDGSSFEISIMAIGAQLNKELILNMRPLFVGQNRGRITRADVKVFVEGYLMSKTAQDDTDNLIIKFENVSVSLVEGDFDVRYAYVPNGPINKVFVTGFMIDTNL